MHVPLIEGLPGPPAYRLSIDTMPIGHVRRTVVTTLSQINTLWNGPCPPTQPTIHCLFSLPEMPLTDGFSTNHPPPNISKTILTLISNSSAQSSPKDSFQTITSSPIEQKVFLTIVQAYNRHAACPCNTSPTSSTFTPPYPVSSYLFTVLQISNSSSQKCDSISKIGLKSSGHVQTWELYPSTFR